MWYQIAFRNLSDSIFKPYGFDFGPIFLPKWPAFSKENLGLQALPSSEHRYLHPDPASKPLGTNLEAIWKHFVQFWDYFWRSYGWSKHHSYHSKSYIREVQFLEQRKTNHWSTFGEPFPFDVTVFLQGGNSLHITSFKKSPTYPGDNQVIENTSCIFVFRALPLVRNLWLEIIHALRLLSCKLRRYTSAC